MMNKSIYLIAFAVSIFLNIATAISLAALYYVVRVETLYSDGFDEGKFESITCTATPKDVLNKLGPPLVVEYRNEQKRIIHSIDGKEIQKEMPLGLVHGAAEIQWWYTRQADLSISYDMRLIRFSPDGKLLQAFAGRVTE